MTIFFYWLLSLQSCVWEVWCLSDSFHPTSYPPFYWEIIDMQHFISSRHTEWWFDLYIWWNDHHHGFSYFIVYLNQYTKKKRNKKEKLVFLWRTLKIDSLDNFLVYRTAGFAAGGQCTQRHRARRHCARRHHTRCHCAWRHIPSTQLRSAGSLCLGPSSSNSFFPHPPPLATTSLIFFLCVFLFCYLFVCRFHK